MVPAPPSSLDIGFWSGINAIYARMSLPRRRQFYFVLILMIAGAAAELATLGSILPFLSLLTETGRWPTAPWLDLSGTIGISPLAAGGLVFGLLAVIAGAERLWLVHSVQDFSYRLGHEILVEIERRFLLQPYAFHLENNSSTLLAAIEQVEALVFDIIIPAMQALVASFIALFILAALVWIDPFAALVAAGGSAAVYLVVSAVARKRLKLNSDIVGETFNSRMKVAQESLGGIRDIIIDASQDMHVRQFQNLDLKLNVARANTAFIAAAPRYIIETVGILIIVLIAVVLAGQRGGVAAALPILGAIAFGAQRLLPLLQQVFGGWSTASGFLSLLSRTAELLRLPVPIQSGLPVDPLPLKRAIVIDGLGFAYRGRRRAALDSITFEIPAGSMVALVGETGSGKSTLADLLMGLLEPTEGSIKVDGVPLTNEWRRQWQRSIAHVPQSIFLADTTIARNVALAVGETEPDLVRVMEAARKAQLHSFVESLPDGYDTIVGERGVRMSGGQRQRLGLARAIYKQVPVLVLDEVTSALDETTETAVMDALDDLRRQGRTILLIAHRRSTIDRAGRIVTLDKGRVVKIERGVRETDAAAVG